MFTKFIAVSKLLFYSLQLFRRSKLSTLFGGDDPSDNASLKYTAPKEPKKKKPGIGNLTCYCITKYAYNLFNNLIDLI